MTDRATTASGCGKHRVVVIGSGFGGLFGTKALRRADVEVTMIARTTHHLFQPLLYQVATGILSGEVAPPIREVLRRQKNATVLLFLTFVVVGAGPTGVEMAGQVAELARRTLTKDFHHIRNETARVVLVDAAPRVLPPFGVKLGDKSKMALEESVVEVVLGAMVTHVDEQGVEMRFMDCTVERIESVAKVWAAGVHASELGRTLAQQTGVLHWWASFVGWDRSERTATVQQIFAREALQWIDGGAAGLVSVPGDGDTAAPLPRVHGATETYLDRDSRGAVRP